MKLRRYIFILLITFWGVFLFGCQEQTQQEIPKDVASEVLEKPQVQQVQSDNESNNKDVALQGNSQAQQKLMFAQNSFDMAQKGILSYSQAVAQCRSIIKDYPGTEYEQKARQMLQLVPEDQRERYKLTDQELGFQNESN